MNVVICAGGNQTRFGMPVNVQPKVLTVLPTGQTLIQNTIDQLQAAGVQKVIVAVADKLNISDYIATIAGNYSVPIETDIFKPLGIGEYIFRYREQTPVTILFGDTYFPADSLSEYFTDLARRPDNFTAFVGASHKHVGDYRILTKNSLVRQITKEADQGYYTCGVFSILDIKAYEKISPVEKLTETFSQILENNGQIGFHVFPDGLVDIDTRDKLAEIKLVKK